MEKYISIKEASILIEVTTTTIRRWESDEKLKPHHRTLGNHRRYALNDILTIIKPECSTEPVVKKQFATQELVHMTKRMIYQDKYKF